MKNLVVRIITEQTNKAPAVTDMGENGQFHQWKKALSNMLIWFPISR